MGEDDDLAILRRRLQHAGEAVHARRVHRLHGIVDDDEPERRLGQRRARDEQRQRQRVQLALAHHAQRHALDAVHGDVQVHLALGRRAGEPDVLQRDVALLAELRPDGLALLLDGLELLGAQQRDGVLQPGLGRLQRLDGLVRRAGVAGQRQPARGSATRSAASGPRGAGPRQRPSPAGSTTASRSGPVVVSMAGRDVVRGPIALSAPSGTRPARRRTLARSSPTVPACCTTSARGTGQIRGAARSRRRPPAGPRWPRGRRRGGASPPSPAARATRRRAPPSCRRPGRAPSPCAVWKPQRLIEHVGQILRSRGQRAGGRLQGPARRRAARAMAVSDLRPRPRRAGWRSAAGGRARGPRARRRPRGETMRSASSSPQSSRPSASSEHLRAVVRRAGAGRGGSGAHLGRILVRFRSRVFRASASRACAATSVVEAEDRRQRVVQVRRPLLEHRAELAVGKEGPEADQRRRPSERVEVRLRLALDLDARCDASRAARRPATRA